MAICEYISQYFLLLIYYKRYLKPIKYFYFVANFHVTAIKIASPGLKIMKRYCSNVLFKASIDPK